MLWEPKLCVKYFYISSDGDYIQITIDLVILDNSYRVLELCDNSIGQKYADVAEEWAFSTL